MQDFFSRLKMIYNINYEYFYPSILPGGENFITNNPLTEYTVSVSNNDQFIHRQYIRCLTFVYAVTMQAQKAPPPDMACKDKFLVQCTVVAEETAEEDITSAVVHSQWII